MILNLPQKQQVKSDLFYGNQNTTELPPPTAFMHSQRTGLETVSIYKYAWSCHHARRDK